MQARKALLARWWHRHPFVEKQILGVKRWQRKSGNKKIRPMNKSIILVAILLLVVAINLILIIRIRKRPNKIV